LGISDASLNDDPRYQGRYTVITGGAGFIGCNLADRPFSNGHDVLLYDNLSRAGVRDNREWLRSRHAERVKTAIADIRGRATLHSAVRHAGQVFHLAAQAAVRSDHRKRSSSSHEL
jgi:CDP-paratose 2-epimerase